MSPSGRRITIVFALREKKKLLSSLKVLFCLEEMDIFPLLQYVNTPSSLQNRIERHEGVIQSPELFFYLPLCLLRLPGLANASVSSLTQSPCPPQA